MVAVNLKIRVSKNLSMTSGRQPSLNVHPGERVSDRTASVMKLNESFSTLTPGFIDLDGVKV